MSKKKFDDTGNLTREITLKPEEAALLKSLLSQLSFSAIEENGIKQAQIAKGVFDKLG